MVGWRRLGRIGLCASAIILALYMAGYRLTPFRDCLADGEPLSGRLQPDKHALLYGERGGEVASSALMPMPGTGLIAVGSRDANRFYPGMGTLFLRMMAEALATGLQRFW